MSGRRLNALFLGAPDPVSVGIARGWQMGGHNIAAIWYPEKLARADALERDRELAKSAPALTLHGMAERGGVAVRAVPRLASWPEVVTEAATLCVDVVISALFMDRIPRSMISAFPDRIVNLHPSLLPAYRGRYPLFNMLWDRTIDRYGGMTLHVVAPEFDTGDILAQAPVPLAADISLAAYNMHLVRAGATLLNEHMPRYFAGEAIANPQPAGEARQGTRRPSQAEISNAHSADDIAWFCKTIPQLWPLRIAGLNGLHVTQFIEAMSAPTGAPPELDGATVTLDARDRRVRLAVRG